MKNSECACSAGQVKHQDAARFVERKQVRRLADGIRFMLPAIGLALIPKCPVCLAGYLALGTGIGLSFTAASYLRTVLILLCVLSMAYFVAKRVYRFLQ